MAAAACSGVRPASLFALTSAPWPIKNDAKRTKLDESRHSAVQESNNGVSSSPVLADVSAPRSASASAASK